MPTASKRRLLVAVIAGALAALAAGPAYADSLVFTRNGNIWLIRPDGSRLRQVTRGGGYSSASQTESGVIVALRNRYLVRLTRRGKPIGSPVPLVGTSVRYSGGLTIAVGPADVRVSPNGRLVAYWIGTIHQTCDPVSGQCEQRLQDNVLYSFVDRFTDPGRFGFARDYREPSWLTNTQTLVFNYGLATTVAVDPVGGGDEDLAGWFSDPDGMQLARGQLAARADTLALLRGTNHADAPQETIRLYDVKGTPPVARPVCDLSGAANGKFTQPVWKPNGAGLAWVESDGIHVASIPDLTVESPACSSIRPRFLVAGNQPFWGPADVGPRDGLAPRRVTAAGGWLPSLWGSGR